MEEVHKEKERVKERDLQKRLARLERDQPQPPGKLLQVLWIRMLEIRIHPMQKCRSGSYILKILFPMSLFKSTILFLTHKCIIYSILKYRKSIFFFRNRFFLRYCRIRHTLYRLKIFFKSIF